MSIRSITNAKNTKVGIRNKSQHPTRTILQRISWIYPEDGGNVKPATGHMSKVVDNATAKQNLIDAANGKNAHTSCYENAPCTTVALSVNMLNGVQTLSGNFTLSISEIAGGSHSVNSPHYNGVAIDVNEVNGDHVDTKNMTSEEILAFRQAAYDAGATNVLDPLNEPTHHYNHFHIQW